MAKKMNKENISANVSFQYEKEEKVVTTKTEKYFLVVDGKKYTFTGDNAAIIKTYIESTTDEQLLGNIIGLLMQIKGVGATVATNILKVFSGDIEGFLNAIADEEVEKVASAKGVKKSVAEVVVEELKQKIFYQAALKSTSSESANFVIVEDMPLEIHAQSKEKVSYPIVPAQNYPIVPLEKEVSATEEKEVKTDSVQSNVLTRDMTREEKLAYLNLTTKLHKQHRLGPNKYLSKDMKNIVTFDKDGNEVVVEPVGLVARVIDNIIKGAQKREQLKQQKRFQENEILANNQKYQELMAIFENRVVTGIEGFSAMKYSAPKRYQYQLNAIKYEVMNQFVVEGQEPVDVIKTRLKEDDQFTSKFEAKIEEVLKPYRKVLEAREITWNTIVIHEGRRFVTQQQLDEIALKTMEQASKDASDEEIESLIAQRQYDAMESALKKVINRHKDAFKHIKPEECLNDHVEWINKYEATKSYLAEEAYNMALKEEKSAFAEVIKTKLQQRKQAKQKNKELNNNLNTVLNGLSNHISNLNVIENIPQAERAMYEQQLFNGVLSRYIQRPALDKEARALLEERLDTYHTAGKDDTYMLYTLITIADEVEQEIAVETDNVRKAVKEEYLKYAKAWVGNKDTKHLSFADVKAYVEKHKELATGEYWNEYDQCLDILDVMAEGQKKTLENVTKMAFAKYHFDQIKATDPYLARYYEIHPDELQTQSQAIVLDDQMRLVTKVGNAVDNQLNSDFVKYLTEEQKQNIVEQLSTEIIMHSVGADNFEPTKVYNQVSIAMATDRYGYQEIVDTQTRVRMDHFNADIESRIESTKAIIEQFEAEGKTFEEAMASFAERYDYKDIRKNLVSQPNRVNVNAAEAYLDRLNREQQADRLIAKAIYEDVYRKTLTYKEYLDALNLDNTRDVLVELEKDNQYLNKLEQERIAENQAKYESIMKAAKAKDRYAYISPTAVINRHDVGVQQRGFFKRVGAFFARHAGKIFDVALIAGMAATTILAVTTGTGLVGFINGGLLIAGGATIINAAVFGKFPFMKDILKNRLISYATTKGEVERSTRKYNKYLNKNDSKSIVARMDRANELLNELQNLDCSKKQAKKIYKEIRKLLGINGRSMKFQDPKKQSGLTSVTFSSSIITKMAKRLGVHRQRTKDDFTEADLARLMCGDVEKLYYGKRKTYGLGKRVFGARSVGYAIHQLEKHDKYRDQMSNTYVYEDSEGNKFYVEGKKAAKRLQAKGVKVTQLSVIDNYIDDYNHLVDQSSSIARSIQAIWARTQEAKILNDQVLQGKFNEEQVKEMAENFRQETVDMVTNVAEAEFQQEQLLLNAREVMEGIEDVAITPAKPEIETDGLVVDESGRVATARPLTFDEIAQLRDKRIELGKKNDSLAKTLATMAQQQKQLQEDYEGLIVQKAAAGVAEPEKDEEVIAKLKAIAQQQKLVEAHEKRQSLLQKFFDLYDKMQNNQASLATEQHSIILDNLYHEGMKEVVVEEEVEM